MPRTPKPKHPGGRPAGHASGATTPLTVRLSPAVRSEATAAADREGRQLSSWAADAIERSARPDQPRFAQLEDVLRYVAELDAAGRDAFIDLAIAPLLDDPSLLRAAIALAWAAGRGELVRAVCEEHAERAAGR